jgi:hypothetical protein
MEENIKVNYLPKYFVSIIKEDNISDGISIKDTAKIAKNFSFLVNALSVSLLIFPKINGNSIKNVINIKEKANYI